MEDVASAPAAPPRSGWLRAWGPALLAAAAIFALSSLPGQQLVLPPWRFLDKALHALVFGGLFVVVLRGLRLRTSLPVRSRHLLAMGLVVLYGISDELHQLFVPGRHADLLDVLADASGALLGSLLVLGLEQVARRAPGRATRRMR